MRVVAPFIALALAVGAVEGGSWALNRRRPDQRSRPNRVDVQYANDVRPHTVMDPTLGYTPSVGGKATVFTYEGEKLINRATYSTDRYRRRIDPADHGGPRARAALFFGCSFTFGSGVNDDQTLPHYFAEHAPSYRAYNYGYGGYGPQQTLARITATDFAEGVKESRAVGIYTFIDDHTHRAIGSMKTHNQKKMWGLPMPYYELDGQDRLVRRGDYESGRPLTSFLYRQLGRSEALHRYNVNLPPRLTAAHFHLVARMLEDARLGFEQRFPGGNFYVVFYPGSQFAPRLAPELRERGVRVLDYSDWFGWNEPGMWIEGYGHPTAAAYARIGERLARDIIQSEEIKLTFSAAPSR